MLTGVSISNLALGYANSVQVLVFSSASFNANVVSTGFILGGFVPDHNQRARTKKLMKN